MTRPIGTEEMHPLIFYQSLHSDGAAYIDCLVLSSVKEQTTLFDHFSKTFDGSDADFQVSEHIDTSSLRNGPGPNSLYSSIAALKTLDPVYQIVCFHDRSKEIGPVHTCNPYPGHVGPATSSSPDTDTLNCVY